MLKKISSVVALVWISLSSFAQFPPPFVHNPLDTNTLGTAPSTSYFLGWNGTKPAWNVPPDTTGMFVAVNTNAVAVTNGSLVTISGVTDTNAVRGLITAATNNDALVSIALSNYVATISANATNNDANSTNFALLIGANGTNNDNLHALNNTNFSLLLGVNATNNDANSTNFTLLVGGNDTNEVTRQAATKQLDWLNPNNYIFIEEFEGRSSGDLTLGQHGWRVLGVGSGSSSVTLNAAASVHPGMVSLTPGGTVSGGMLVMMSGTTNGASDLLLPANTLPVGGGNSFTAWTNRWIFRTGAATNDMKCWIGLVNNIVYGNAKPADFIGVELDTTNNVNIQYISGASSTYTNVSGPLISVSTWYNFVMYSTVNGTINFYINNANPGVINTSGNISTLGLNFLADVWKTATTAQATMTLDYCSFIGTGTAR